MSGNDSSRKSQIPSSPPSTTSLSAEPVVDPGPIVTPLPARSPAKEPNTGNPIVVGLLGICLVGLAGVGGGYLHTHPKLPVPSRISPEPAPLARVSPAPADALPAEAKPVNPPSQVNSVVTPPSTIPEGPVSKRSTPDVKKTPPKAAVKEVGSAIVSHPTLPTQTVVSAPQPPEPQPPSPAPQPPLEKHEEAKEPTITVQPAPLVTVKVSDGLPIRILLTEDVPADAPEGLTLQFVVAASVQVDNATIIAKGAAVTASIAGHKKKILGIGSTKVTYQLRTVHTVDGNQLRVRATSSRNADGTSTYQFDPPKGSTKKGVAALQGTEYIGYIDTDQTVAVRK
jgi:hypothetical protein